MIYLFHGSGQLGMLTKVSEIRKGLEPLEIHEYSGKEKNWGEVVGEISSSGLFSSKRLVILEDFQDVVLEKLPGSPDLTIILKFTKSLLANSTLLKNLPQGVQVIIFPEEKETPIFPLIDLLAEKNPRALGELDKHQEEWGGQYILTMIFYMLRRFILPQKSLPAFALKKIESQRKNFPLEKIRDYYHQVLETDYKIKEGLIEERIALYLLAEKFITV